MGGKGKGGEGQGVLYFGEGKDCYITNTSHISFSFQDEMETVVTLKKRCCELEKRVIELEPAQAKLEECQMVNPTFCILVLDIYTFTLTAEG